jgi:hypothetical protein
MEAAMARAMPKVFLVAVLAGAMLTVPGQQAAFADHEESCTDTPFVIPVSVKDHTYPQTVEAVVGAAVIAAETVHEVLEDTPEVPAEAVGVAAGVVSAAQAAQLAIEYIDREADVCRTDVHWEDEEALMKMNIEADLAVTTTPDSAFVLPTDDPDLPPGFIDAPVIGVKDIVNETIEKMESTGQCGCTSAKSYYNQAVTAMDAGNYKTAYKLFRQAYVLAFSN